MRYERPVIILGAGATKACGGPLTGELLPTAYDERLLHAKTASLFLKEMFFVPFESGSANADCFPALPLLLSLLDQAIDRREPFAARWPPDRLAEVRRDLEFAVFAVVRNALMRGAISDCHDRLIAAYSNSEPVILSLNYDVIVDNALLRLAHGRGAVMPSYGITSSDDSGENRYGQLLKLHGSLNWVYCPNCGRLDLTRSQDFGYFVKAADVLFLGEDSCRVCNATMRPIMITPTQLKDYRNPYIAGVWQRADFALRRADRAIFIGYSLPDDDLEVIYLLKRALSHLSAESITVVEQTTQPRSENAVFRRYRTLFGSDLDWQPGGFEKWLSRNETDGHNPLYKPVLDNHRPT